MAELTLTQAEMDADHWTDLSDNALGKVARATMAQIDGVAKEQDRLVMTSVALLLVSYARTLNVGQLTVSLGGVTEGDERVGGWVITTIREGDPPA